MELWEKGKKVSDIILITKAKDKPVVAFGQTAPLETFKMLSIVLAEYVAVGMGSQFTIHDGDVIIPVSIDQIQEADDRCLAYTYRPDNFPETMLNRSV